MEDSHLKDEILYEIQFAYNSNRKEFEDILKRIRDVIVEEKNEKYFLIKHTMKAMNEKHMNNKIKYFHKVILNVWRNHGFFVSRIYTGNKRIENVEFSADVKRLYADFIIYDEKNEKCLMFMLLINNDELDLFLFPDKHEKGKYSIEFLRDMEKSKLRVKYV